MSETVGLALLSGTLLGFILGFIAAAKISKDILKDRASKGNIKISGSTYRLTEIKP